MATLPYWSKADLAKFLAKRLCTSCKNRGVSTIAEAMACSSCRVFKRRGRPPARDHIADNNAAESTQNTQMLNEELLYAAANAHTASHVLQSLAGAAGPLRETAASALSLRNAKVTSNAFGIGMGNLFQSQTQASAFEALASNVVGAGPSAQAYMAACDAALNTGAVGVAGLSAVAGASLPLVYTPFGHTTSNTSSNVPFGHTTSNTSSHVRPAAAYPRSVHVCVRRE